jgi:hypothetical protein
MYEDASSGYQSYPGNTPTVGGINHWLFGGPNYYDTRGSLTSQGQGIFDRLFGLYDTFSRKDPFKLNLGGQVLDVVSPFQKQSIKSLLPLLQVLAEFETGRKGSVASSGTEKGNWSSILSMVGGGMSDESLKENIQPVIVSEDEVAKLKQLRAVSFNWKGTNINDSGVIAQDVQKVFPDCVAMNPNGFLMVNYSRLLGKAIAALQV